MNFTLLSIKNKINILFFFTCCLFFSFCNKTSKPEEKTPPKKDEIIYKTFGSLELQTVRYTKYQDVGICSATIPTPSDSSVSEFLDLDNDSIYDFQISAWHAKYISSYCGHCPRYTYSISIKGLTNKDSIVNITSSDWHISKLFNSSDTIHIKNNWKSDGQLVLQEGCVLPFFTDFITGYIGVKIDKSVGYIQIERLQNNGIRILSTGFNKTTLNSIKCGQK